MSKPCLLIGDLGATLSRFALVQGGGSGFSQPVILRSQNFASPDAAIAKALAEMGHPRPDVICLGVAAQIKDQQGRFINRDWSISAAALQLEYPGARVFLMNDTEAMARAIPHLQGRDMALVSLAPPRPLGKQDFTVCLMAIGSGLGTAALCRREGRTFVVSGEGGHVGFAAETYEQAELLRELREQFGRVSAERLVSGFGVENVYRAVSRLRGEPDEPTLDKEVFSRFITLNEAGARQAVMLLFRVMGQVAGDLALTFNALDGVYLAGGLAQSYVELVLNGPFRQGFEYKGRYSDVMKTIPVQLVTHPFCALVGLSHHARGLWRAREKPAA